MTNEKRKGAFLFQRFSMVIQRYNAVAILCPHIVCGRALAVTAFTTLRRLAYASVLAYARMYGMPVYYTFAICTPGHYTLTSCSFVYKGIHCSGQVHPQSAGDGNWRCGIVAQP